MWGFTLFSIFANCKVRVYGNCSCAHIEDFYQHNSCCNDPNGRLPSFVTHADVVAQPVGGTLYVYTQGSSSWSAVVDLASIATHHDGACLPRSTPHMVIPRPNDHKYVAITYTTDKYVHVMNSDTKEIVACFGVPHVPNAQIHDGAWFQDANDVWYFTLVDMTGVIGDSNGGGGLHLFRLEDTQPRWKATLVDSWSASQALQLPAAETKPISMGNNNDGDARHRGTFFVTDANYGGGYFVSLSEGGIHLLSHLNNATLVHAGCGAAGTKLYGLWTAAHPTDSNIIIAQYGQQIANRSCLLELNASALHLNAVIPLSERGVDAHGLGYCFDEHDKLYVIVTHRVSATMDIVDYDARALVRQDIDLDAVFRSVAPASDVCVAPLEASEPRFQPDVFSMRDRTLHFSARGRRPLSAVLPGNWLRHASPGMYTIDMTPDCLGVDTSKRFALGVVEERALTKASDPHGANRVGDEFWLIDQSPTGLRIDRGDDVWLLPTTDVDAFRQSNLNTLLFVERAMMPDTLPCIIAPPASPPLSPGQITETSPSPPPPSGAGGMG